MCPVCIATVAQMVAGATSTGGLTALVMNRLRARTGAKNINHTIRTRGEQNETTNEQSESSESRVPS
jgi:hypothetical protein